MRAFNRILEQMSFKQLTFVAIGAGIFMCLLIFFALSRIEQNVAQEVQVQPIPMRRIVVARTNIKRGEILQERMLRTKEFAVNSLPDGTSTDIREFVGMPAKVEIFSGDIITTDKLFKDTRQAGFIGMIPENCRAITIPIDNVTGVAGLVNPGNYVDLVLVTQEQGATKAEILLQNIMLLGIDKTVDRDMGEIDSRNRKSIEDTKANADQAEVNASPSKNLSNASNAVHGNGTAPTGVSGGTATLALLPDEVLKVVAAMKAGAIHLVLRPLNPTGDSMYIKNSTEYFGEVRSEKQIERTVPQVRYQNRVSQPISQPQSESPKTIKSEIPKDTKEITDEVEQPKGFEVIKWGS